MTARMEWTGTIQITQNMSNYGDALKQMALGIGESVAPRMETDAKHEAKWQDRTANARQSLNGRAWQTDNGDVTIIQLSHGVFYGLFLEVRNQGRFAIVIPMMQRYYPIVWNMVKEALK